MEEQHEGLQRALTLLRIVFVHFYMLILLALNAASLPVFDIGTVTPYFLLMGIYFWGVNRPGMIPSYLVFIFGILLDIVTGQPIGLNALSFLLIYFILYGQRRFLKGQAWPVLWFGFGIAAILVSAIHMLVFILTSWVWPGVTSAVLAVLISFLAYPLVIAPMIALNKFMR